MDWSNRDKAIPDLYHLSDEHYRRNELLRHVDVPLQSEVIKQHGDVLSGVFFETLDDTCAMLMGITTPLQGPQGDLWIDPDNQLSGDVKLTLPETKKYIIALTHYGILELGVDIEARTADEIIRYQNDAVADNREMLKFMSSQFTGRTLSEIVKQYEEELDKIRAKWQSRMEQELLELEEELLLRTRNIFDVEKQKYDQIRNGIPNSKEEMLEYEKTLDIEFELATDKLLKKCDIAQGIKHDIRIHHIAKLDKWTNDSLESQRHAMEDEQTAGMMCAICAERSQCAQRLQALRAEYSVKLSSVQRDVEAEISSHSISSNVIYKLNQIYENRVEAIVVQFKKFINFAMQSVPSQTDFLVNLHLKLCDQMKEAIVTDTVTEIPPVEKIKGSSKKKVHMTTVRAPCADQYICRQHKMPVPKPFLLFDEDGEQDPSSEYKYIGDNVDKDEFIVLGGYSYTDRCKLITKRKKIESAVDWKSKLAKKLIEEMVESIDEMEECMEYEDGIDSAKCDDSKWCVPEPKEFLHRVKSKHDPHPKPFVLDNVCSVEPAIQTKRSTDVSEVEPRITESDTSYETFQITREMMHEFNSLKNYKTTELFEVTTFEDYEKCSEYQWNMLLNKIKVSHKPEKSTSDSHIPSFTEVKKSTSFLSNVEIIPPSKQEESEMLKSELKQMATELQIVPDKMEQRMEFIKQMISDLGEGSYSHLHSSNSKSAFTDRRMRSIMDMIKSYPSLCYLFTNN